MGYLEKGASHFIKVTKNDEKTNKNGKKAKTISNLKDESIKKSFISRKK